MALRDDLIPPGVMQGNQIRSKQNSLHRSRFQKPNKLTIFPQIQVVVFFGTSDTRVMTKCQRFFFYFPFLCFTSLYLENLYPASSFKRSNANLEGTQLVDLSPELWHLTRSPTQSPFLTSC